MNKRKIIIYIFVFLLIVILTVLGLLIYKYYFKETDENKVNVQQSYLKELPKPEITAGLRGELGIDKNINETTIDEYLNREDAVYRDLRMLEDPGNYEKIGGDRFLSGYVKGFEVVPLPYIVTVTGLPSEVGDTYTGTTLFSEIDGRYIANYQESMNIIEKLFPKDKVIFLMCGGGGYAGMAKNFLVSLGWDENKIYNVGGFWYYKGKNSVDVKKEENGVISYDFDSVPYHNIDFNKLTKSPNYVSPKVKVTDVKINTKKIELEVGSSFKLNAIVLPNNATNKKVMWTSNNESVVNITEDGLIQAVGAGKATIVVETVDGDKKALCEVVVKELSKNMQIELDDISKEVEEFNSNDLLKLYDEYDKIVYNPDETIKEKYATINSDGEEVLNDLGEEELEKYLQKEEKAKKRRVEIINELIDNKKSFVILLHSKNCEGRDYVTSEGAIRILDKNNYSYFYIDPLEDETLYNTKIPEEDINTTSIIIFNEGKVYAKPDLEKHAFKNDEETTKWLSQYIYLE